LMDSCCVKASWGVPVVSKAAASSLLAPHILNETVSNHPKGRFQGRTKRRCTKIRQLEQCIPTAAANCIIF
jgi:hypothetical protein